MCVCVCVCVHYLDSKEAIKENHDGNFTERDAVLFLTNLKVAPIKIAALRPPAYHLRNYS